MKVEIDVNEGGVVNMTMMWIYDECDDMLLKIEPWFEKKNRYTKPRLRPDTPQEIVELYEKYKRLREEKKHSTPYIGANY